MIENRCGLWYLASSEEPVQVSETGARVFGILRLRLFEGRSIPLITMLSIP